MREYKILLLIFYFPSFWEPGLFSINFIPALTEVTFSKMQQAISSSSTKVVLSFIIDDL